MPELPEVESIKLQLNKYLVGHKFKKVEVRYKKCFEGNAKHIEGKKIKEVRRFGKVLSIDTAGDYSVVIHIKLTGQLIYRGPNLISPPPISKKVNDGLGGKHTLVIFHLDNPTSHKASKGLGEGRLFYNDFRRFGWIKIMKTSKVEDEDEFAGKLGPEPLADITKTSLEKLTLPKFKEITSSTRRSIKTLLMDQKKISGIGNIYANDALWLAQIHPEKKSNELSGKELKALFKAIETVLRRGLEYGGASELSYVTPDGGEGTYQKHFLAYGKEKEKCQRCGGNLKRIKVGGRGTFFCPKCQRL